MVDQDQKPEFTVPWKGRQGRKVGGGGRGAGFSEFLAILDPVPPRLPTIGCHC